jgi:hypothetical protein
MLLLPVVEDKPKNTQINPTYIVTITRRARLGVQVLTSIEIYLANATTNKQLKAHN